LACKSQNKNAAKILLLTVTSMNQEVLHNVKDFFARILTIGKDQTTFCERYGQTADPPNRLHEAVSGAVVAPGQQRSQVISRSEQPQATSRECTYPQKLTIFFLVVVLKTQRQPTPL